MGVCYEMVGNRSVIDLNKANRGAWLPAHGGAVTVGEFMSLRDKMALEGEYDRGVWFFERVLAWFEATGTTEAVVFDDSGCDDHDALHLTEAELNAQGWTRFDVFDYPAEHPTVDAWVDRYMRVIEAKPAPLRLGGGG